MSGKNTEIKAAIDTLDVNGARALLRDALKEADGETFYLASRVALDDEQRKSFLEKAVNADPFHEQARKDLNKLKGASIPPSVAQLMQTPPQYANEQPPQNYAQPTPSNAPYLVPSRKQKTDDEEFAGGGPRFIAYIIDAFILGIIAFVVGLLLPPPNYYNYQYSSSYLTAFGNWQVGFSAITLIIQAIYSTYFLTQQNGQTPGKKTMKIRVVKINGNPLSVGDALGRNIFGYFVSGLVIGLGFLWIVGDSKHQGWHDKIASTYVVKTE